MYKSQCSVLTAQNATETVKTLIDTLVIPQGVKSIVGVGAQISVAGLTTLEDVTGMLELESDDMAPWGGTQQFLVGGMITGLTSGAVGMNPYLHPTNIPVTPSARVKISMTYNKAQTINPSTRAQLVYE